MDNDCVELAAGENLSIEVSIDLSEFDQWRQLLQAGERYLLKYAMAQAALGAIEILIDWRYGKLEISEYCQCH